MSGLMGYEDYPLFGGFPPHQKYSGPSLEAAARIRPKIKSRWREVLNAFSPDGGFTDWDLVDRVNVNRRHSEQLPKDSVAPRRRELVLLGAVESTGRRGITPYGGSATLWQLTEAGQAILESIRGEEARK